jgi:DNA-binding transcriptional regulator GbsR (MarR family)
MMSDELAELKKISKILTLVNAEILEKELAKYVSTPERKKAWVLIDGQRLPDEIINSSGMKQAALYNFLKLLSNANLIETPHGKAPKKKLDYVPASWLELLQPEAEEKKQKQEGKQDVKTTTNQ